jgi:hypothetical protein
MESARCGIKIRKYSVYVVFGVENSKRVMAALGGAGGFSITGVFHVRPSMAPTNPRMKPTSNPASAPIQLSIENTRTKIEPFFTLCFSPLSIHIAPKIVSVPQIMPQEAKATTKTMLIWGNPRKPKLAKMPHKIMDERTVYKVPRKISMPPISDSMNAVVGFSSILHPRNPFEGNLLI